MSSESSDPGVTQQMQFDAVCLQFEQEWRRGGQPSIESVLETQPEAGRPLLLHQLLLLELEYAEKAGSPAKIDSYLTRFPQEAAVVRGASESDTINSAKRR